MKSLAQWEVRMLIASEYADQLKSISLDYRVEWIKYALLCG